MENEKDQIFLRDCWYVAAWSFGLKPGTLHGLTIIGEPVVLYRKEDGTPIAMQDRCCHKRAKLSIGRIEGDCLRCMYHGLLFDPSGRCIEIPGQSMIPASAAVRSFPVAERGLWIWVWMGDPARADLALIPETVPIDDPAWDQRTGQMDYRANYELVNDNLTDFSHLSFVHPNSFGASPHWAQIRPQVQRLERGIRVSRWITGGADENRNVSSTIGRSAETPCTFISYDYLVPGILLLSSKTYRLEDYPADGISPPTGTPVMANSSVQAVTPMTQDETRYFFTAGLRKGPNSAPKVDKMLEVTKIAFEEDRAMIETQAANIKLAGGSEIRTSADLAPAQFRSVLRALIKRQDAGSADLDVSEPAAARG